jgi:hypothetical protein
MEVYPQFTEAHTIRWFSDHQPSMAVQSSPTGAYLQEDGRMAMMSDGGFK